jgi:hypothetical protein
MKRPRAIPNTAEHKEDHSSDTSSSENTTTAASTSSSESSSNDVTEYLANTGERTNPKLQKKNCDWLQPKDQTTPRIGEDFQVSLPPFQPPSSKQ